MELEEVLRRRRMVRRFTDAPIDPTDRDRLLAAALRGPSAGFRAGVRVPRARGRGRPSPAVGDEPRARGRTGRRRGDPPRAADHRAAGFPPGLHRPLPRAGQGGPGLGSDVAGSGVDHRHRVRIDAHPATRGRPRPRRRVHRPAQRPARFPLTLRRPRGVPADRDDHCRSPAAPARDRRPAELAAGRPRARSSSDAGARRARAEPQPSLIACARDSARRAWANSTTCEATRAS